MSWRPNLGWDCVLDSQGLNDVILLSVSSLGPMSFCSVFINSYQEMSRAMGDQSAIRQNLETMAQHPQMTHVHVRTWTILLCIMTWITRIIFDSAPFFHSERTWIRRKILETKTFVLRCKYESGIDLKEMIPNGDCAPVSQWAVNGVLRTVWRMCSKMVTGLTTFTKTKQNKTKLKAYKQTHSLSRKPTLCGYGISFIFSDLQSNHPYDRWRPQRSTLWLYSATQF